MRELVDGQPVPLPARCSSSLSSGSAVVAGEHEIVSQFNSLGVIAPSDKLDAAEVVVLRFVGPSVTEPLQEVWDWIVIRKN